MKPLIGITTGPVTDVTDPTIPTIYGQKHGYSDAIVAAGGIPVHIPLMPEDELKNLYERLDGIVFAGGDDIDPRLYGEEFDPTTVNVSTERDRVDSLLMAWAIADDKPLFAICRGFQLLNILQGGNLYQNVAASLPNASDHELLSQRGDFAYIAHRLKVEPTSKLAAITDSLQLDANTRHHQGIKRIANELRAVAWSEDGLVEGLEYPSKKFVLGVQSHPELLYTKDEKWLAVFRAFIAAASKKPASVSLFKFKRRIKAQ